MDMLKLKRIFKPILKLAVTALVMLATVPGLLADDDTMPGNGRVPAHARDNMRAFAAEQHLDQNLAAQSITACVGGLAGTYPCSNVDLLAFLPLNQIGGGDGSDIWGWTDSTNGKEYAIMGLSTGTAFVDISDPVNPVYLGLLPPHSGNSSWRDIKTYDDHAFIGSEASNSGMQVFDLTQLRSVVSPPVTFAETAFYNGFGDSHDIAINEDSAYAYGIGLGGGNCNGGLHFVDILNPTNPLDAGCFSADGYSHDAQCVNYHGPDTDHQGKEICFAYNSDTLTIVDVSNKESPVQISRTGYTNRGYTHQGWLTEDQAYLLLGDELDERNFAAITNTRTLIWNVQDLDNPVHTGDYIGPSTSIDHNQFIVGNYSYQANYTSGLRILDISDIANSNLAEVGFFDIYPSSDSTTFNGAWGVYPFFASGIVIVSGIEQGLYILQPNLNVPGDPPVVNILSPVDNDPTPLSGVVQIQIDATDTEDADGTLTVEWNVDGGAWQLTVYSSPDYVANWDTGIELNGAHVVNARAVDSDLREGNDASNVTIANDTPQFTVDAINVSITVGKGNRNTGNATLMVSDESDSPLSEVAIEGSFSVGWIGTRKATTGDYGEADFKTPKVKNLAFIQFCVDLASKAGWSLDIDNSTLCGDSDGGGSAFGTVAGHVTDAADGTVIPFAAVSTDSGQSADSDLLGNYSIANVPVGNRNVSVTAGGYDEQNTSPTVTQGTITTVDFALNESTAGGTGSVKGTLYSIAGGKLSGVTLQVFGGSSSLTNKGGKYTIQNVTEGSQSVTASKDGYSSQQKFVDVNAGRSVTLDFTLAPEESNTR